MILFSLCTSSTGLRVLLIIKIVLQVICTIIPLIIIYRAFSTSLKNSIDGRNEVKKDLSTLFKNLIAGLIIFLIPTMINFTFSSLINAESDFISCINNASLEGVLSAEAREEQEAIDKKKEEEQKADSTSKEMQEKRKKEIEEAAKKRKEQEEKYNNKYKGNQEDVTVSTGGINSSEFNSKLSSMSTPSKSQLESAAEKNGITHDYLVIVIGTSQREGYVNDPYLYYGWASAMLNNKVTISQMQSWDPSNSGEANYYSQTNINNGYNNASDTVLKAVYLALTERNTKIIECNGMYSQTPSSYNCIYASTVYNCSIYETK